MKAIFERIWALALPYQDQRDDQGHAEVTLRYARMLVELEAGDEDIVVPAVILHDIGWSQLTREDRLLIFRKDVKEEDRRRVVNLHQEASVRLARDILNEVNYPEDLSREIIEIVSQHDTRKGFISKNDGIVRDADKLWRFSEEGFRAGLARRRPTDESIHERIHERLKTDIERPDYFYFERSREIARRQLELRKGTP